MIKTGVVIIMAIAALAAFGSTALAQPSLPEECDPDRLGLVSECFKSPVFFSADDVARYKVISLARLTVEGGDCCISGDSWKIQVFLPGRDEPDFDPIKESTTGTAAIGNVCPPPTSGYTGRLHLPLPFVYIVKVKPGAITNGYPQQMFLRFEALGALRIVQVEGGDGCGL
jgi:hypothetical protein